MKSLVIIFITYTALIGRLQGLNLIPDLLQECKDYSEMESQYEESKQNYEQTHDGVDFTLDTTRNLFDYELEIKNLKKLTSQILQGKKPVGSGSFGTVFTMNYITGKKEIPMAVKLMNVMGDSNDPEQKEEQEMLVDEIRSNKFLNKKDSNDLFISTFFNCMTVTKHFGNVLKEIEIPTPQEKYLQVTESKEKMAIQMEKLDFNLNNFMATYLQSSHKNKFNTSLNFRMPIGLALSLGLQFMNKYTLHCDIKPDNIMFKRIDRQKSNSLHSNKVPFLELLPGKLFQVKFIDFGMSAFYNREGKPTTCGGGSPGFLPFEYFADQDGSMSSKFDVFSLGSALLDYELTVNGLSTFSHSRAICDNMITKRKPFADAEDLVDSLRKDKFLIAIVGLIDRPDIRPEFWDRLLALLRPGLKADLMEIFEEKDIRNVNPSKILLFDPELLGNILIAGLPYLALTIYNPDTLEKKIKPYRTLLERLQKQVENNKLLQQSESQAEKNRKEYLNAKINIIQHEHTFGQAYFEVLVSMVHPNYLKRASIDDVVTEIQRISVELNKAIKNDWFTVQSEDSSEMNEQDDETTNLVIQSILVQKMNQKKQPSIRKEKKRVAFNRNAGFNVTKKLDFSGNNANYPGFNVNKLTVGQNQGIPNRGKNNNFGHKGVMKDSGQPQAKLII